MRHPGLRLAVAAILCGFLLMHSAVAAAPVPLYGKFEASFTLDGQTGNPFDPAENDIDVAFSIPTRPGGAHIPVVIPAFWDGSTWRVRFAPTKVGLYSIIRVTRNGEKIEPIDLSSKTFVSAPSGDDGFIRRDPKTIQRFVFDDGRPYYPFGIDVAWQNPGDPGYPGEFARMKSAGLNWARIWMNYWDGKNLEWAQTAAASPPIGAYSMEAAAKWDQIMDLAAANGIYIQMTLQHHGEYTNQDDPNWANNPFNAANGGFLSKPDEFFTDPRAIALTKAKYRYIVARWGYSDHLLAFELFNEVQNIGEARSHFQDVVNWHKTMMDYLRSIDPYHHMITTSFTEPGQPLSKIGLDYLQPHYYVPDLKSALGALPLETLRTPIFVGEWGPSGGVTMDAAYVHQGVWAGLLTPMAGAAQYWYWDQVEQKDYWPIFRAASGFLQAFHLPDLNDTESVAATADATGARADLVFAPAREWAPTTTSDVTVSPNGNLSGISGMSVFLQGASHRDMSPKPVSFHLDAQSPCRFVVAFSQVSANGAHPTLTLDGGATVYIDFPAAPSTRHAPIPSLSIEAPAGAHVITLGNTGTDWALISSFTVTGYTTPVAVMARGSAHSAIFWVTARAGEDAVVENAQVHLSGLTPGRYRVTLWDTMKGVIVPGGAAAYDNGIVVVKLPAVHGEIAGCVKRL